MVKTEYDYVRGAVVGNFDFIRERYPNDLILKEKLETLTSYCMKLGMMVAKDKSYAERFKKEVKGGLNGKRD